MGGSGIIATEVALALAGRGHELHLFGRKPPVRWVESKERVHFHRVPEISYPLFDESPFTLTLASTLAEVSARHQLDVLQVHYAVPHAISAYLARQALGTSAPRLVNTVHGTDVTLLGGAPELRPVVRLALSESDALTAPSQFLKEAALGLDLSRLPPFEVIPNFVDTTRFSPGAVDRREVLLRHGLDPGGEDVKVLVHVSNFRPIKRLGDVIEIFDRVRARHPRTVLVLIGDGPERTAAEWRVRQRTLNDRVLFTGARSEFVELLRASDVFLLPSESESFGLAALEAMSCGVPVVGASVGGVPEVVCHDETGLLAPVGDVEAMANHVLGLLRDEPRRRRLSQHARARATTEFPLEATVDRYEALYRRVLTARG